MTIRKITTFPAEVLRKKAQPVKKFDNGLQTLVDDMVENHAGSTGCGFGRAAGWHLGTGCRD